MAALRKSTPPSSEELKITVESYVESLTRYEVQKCVKNVKDRSRVYGFSDLDVNVKVS